MTVSRFSRLCHAERLNRGSTSFYSSCTAYTNSVLLLYTLSRAYFFFQPFGFSSACGLCLWLLANWVWIYLCVCPQFLTVAGKEINVADTLICMDEVSRATGGLRQCTTREVKIQMLYGGCTARPANALQACVFLFLSLTLATPIRRFYPNSAYV